MKWGRVEVGADFLFVVALFLYWDDQGIVWMTLLACGLHEMGHLMTLQLLGGQLIRLRLSAVGAEMVVQGALRYSGEILLALSGPLANLLTALTVARWGDSDVFCGINLALALLNCLPVARLDGGRILYALSSLFLGLERGMWLCGVVDWGCSMLLMVVGVGVLAAGGSFTLLILAVWVVWTQKTWKFNKKTLARLEKNE